MDVLRQRIWLWVIIGMIFVSLVISLIFVLINMCISKKDECRISQSHYGPEFYAQSSKYHPKDLEEDLPPLPPRTQFLTSAAQSYENMSELPDYVKVEEELVLPPPPPPYQYQGTVAPRRTESASTEDYDDIGTDGDSQGEDYDDVG